MDVQKAPYKKLFKVNKAISFLAVIAISITFLSCSKSGGGSSSTSGNFTLKYEIKTSSPIKNPVSISYMNGTAQLETDNSFTSGTTWSKTITVTTTNRPFQAVLPATSIDFNTPGNVIGNIYINGNQVAHVENPTTSSSGTIYGIVQLFYLVQ